MSEQTLVQKMAEVMAAVGYIGKDATNDFHNYDYSSADAVFAKVRAELSSRGIAVCGDVEVVSSEMVSNGSKHLLVAKHTLTFTDGKDSLSVSSLGEGIDSGDKASMKGNTAGVKYCLAKAFLLSWGDDPEADPTTDAEAATAKRMQGKQSVQNNPSPALLDQVELPQEYPDFNTLVLDHGGKKGINELRNVAVVARAKGWTQDQLLSWVTAQGVDLADSELKFSDFAKLNAMIKQEA